MNKIGWSKKKSYFTVLKLIVAIPVRSQYRAIFHSLSDLTRIAKQQHQYQMEQINGCNVNKVLLLCFIY